MKTIKTPFKRLSVYMTVMLGSRMHMNKTQITSTSSIISIVGLIFSAY